MTDLSTLEVSRKILDCLKRNPALSSYVKTFQIGGIESARKLFPFVTVETPHRDCSALSMGRNGYMNNLYVMNIYGGTYHSLPEIAYSGGESGGKGIVQLNSDLINAVIPSDFDGAFAGPVRLIGATTAHKVADGGRSWITMVVINGRIKTRK